MTKLEQLKEDLETGKITQEQYDDLVKDIERIAKMEEA